MQKTPKRLSRTTWTEIQGRYERGDSTAEMSKEYGVTRSAIVNQARRNGWKPWGSLKEAAIEKAREEISNDWASQYASKLKNARERHESVFKNIQIVGQRMLQQIAANMGDDKTLHKNLGREVYHLSAVASAIRIGVDGERLTLEMDKISGRPTEEDGFSALAKQFEKLREEGTFDGFFDESPTEEAADP